MFELLKKRLKNRDVKIVLYVTGVLLTIITCYIGYIKIDEKFSIYQFAILKEENPEYFEDKYEELGLNPDYYRINNVVGDYSRLTAIILNTKEVINLEHGVQVVETDLKKIPELKGIDYIFSAIEIENGENKKHINIENFYQGKELELFGTYIFNYEKDELGRTLYNEPNVKNISNNPNKIEEDGHFLYVRIYKFPKNESYFKGFIYKNAWFKDEITQKIEISYKDPSGKQHVEEFTFKLYWVKWMSFIDQFLTLT
jgi:hypothetical protein